MLEDRINDGTNNQRHNVLAYLQLLEKSMRRYMKSYLPKLDSSTISFSIAWSTLFGMLRSMT